jgi:hypothetical protein
VGESPRLDIGEVKPNTAHGALCQVRFLAGGPEELKMSRFMKPEIYEGDFYAVETSHGTWFVPDDCVGTAIQDVMEFESYVEGIPQSYEKKHGFGARLSASGYMDCTEWNVLDSEEEAVSYLCELYDLCACPECGELVDSTQDSCEECSASLENAA